MTVFTVGQNGNRRMCAPAWIYAIDCIIAYFGGGIVLIWVRYSLGRSVDANRDHFRVAMLEEENRQLQRNVDSLRNQQDMNMIEMGIVAAALRPILEMETRNSSVEEIRGMAPYIVVAVQKGNNIGPLEQRMIKEFFNCNAIDEQQANLVVAIRGFISNGKSRNTAAGELEPDTCPICLEAIHNGQEAIQFPFCEHVFHNNCFFPHFKTQKTCACCRGNFAENLIEAIKRGKANPTSRQSNQPTEDGIGGFFSRLFS